MKKKLFGFLIFNFCCSASAADEYLDSILDNSTDVDVKKDHDEIQNVLNSSSVVSKNLKQVQESANDNVSSSKNLHFKDLKVVIVGNKLIEDATIIERANLSAFDEVDAWSINEIIKNLYASGFFETLDVFLNGNSLVISVKENPIVNKFLFDGNSKVSDDDFQKFFKDDLKPRTIFSLSKIKVLTQSIIDVYRSRGYYSVKVNPKIIKLPDNNVNVVFEVTEGPLTSVKKIMFIGNDKFTDYQLKSELLTKETAWWRFWSSDDIYSQQRVEADQESLAMFYKERGYADFKVDTSFSEISEDKQSFYLTFKISEGDIYKIGKIDFKSDIKDIDKIDIKKCLTFKENERFNIKKIEETKYKIIEILSNNGYIFAVVDYDVQNDQKNKKSSVIFTIQQGSKAYVNKIKISGNIITKDEVIRREMLVSEQDAMQTDKIAESIQNIRNLDFFSNVYVTKEQVGENKTNLNVFVDEKSTAMLQLNLGVAIGRGVFSKIGVSEKNFLGEGKYVSGDIMVGKYDKAVSGVYVVPYFLNRKLTLGTSAGVSKTNRSKTNSYKSKGFNYGNYIDYDITKYISHRIGYSFSYDDTTPDDEDSKNPLLIDENGRKIRSKLYSMLSYINLDSHVNTRKGIVLSLYNAYCGKGGNVKYMSHTITGKVYLPIFEKSVVFLRGEAGIIGRGAYIIDRFSLGGDNLRGFDYEGAGPRGRDVRFGDNGTAVRGTRYYSAMLAVGIPITEGVGQVRAVGFTQIGSLWKSNKPERYVYDENRMRMSAGFGIEWNSPIGPISLTYAKAVKKEKYDQTQSFQIGAILID